ncbi:MAG: hypothetical protein RLZZ141_344 [Pseudomonadota bacterium]
MGSKRLLHLLSAPVVYAVIFPLVLLDIAVTLYQEICFRIYGIARVRRARHVVFDRHRLAYLNGLEKLNCTYCSYANGVISYARDIAAATEQYWCPIKHDAGFAEPHPRYLDFLSYGDPSDYHLRLEQLRKSLSKDDGPDEPGI